MFSLVLLFTSGGGVLGGHEQVLHREGAGDREETKKGLVQNSAL